MRALNSCRRLCLVLAHNTRVGIAQTLVHAYLFLKLFCRGSMYLVLSSVYISMIEYSSISNDFFAIRFHKNPNLFKSKGWAMRHTTCIKSSEQTFWQKDDYLYRQTADGYRNQVHPVKCKLKKERSIPYHQIHHLYIWVFSHLGSSRSQHHHVPKQPDE